MNDEMNNVNIQNNVTNKRNNGSSKIVMAILTVLLIGAVGFICYDKFFNTEKPPEPTNNTKEEYAKWMHYILEQNITKIEVSKTPCSEDTFDEKMAILNTEQLKSVFKELMNYKLQVFYAGGGGWDCGVELTIKYQNNGKEYELRYLAPEGHLIPSSDGCATIYDKDLENALNNSADVKVNEDAKGQENVCTMYVILADDNVFDEFFK